MKVVNILLVAALAVSVASSALAESVEGAVKYYVRGKRLTLSLAKKTMTFTVTKKTKFMDVVGKEWPGLDDPKEGIWAISSTVTVKYHRAGKTLVVDSVQFPYGKVDPSLIKPGKPDGPNEIQVDPGQEPELQVKVGDRVPDYTFKTFGGNTLSRESLKGKVVVIDFWATWCGPCKMMSPVMESLHKRYKDKGVVVIGASTDQNIQLAKDYAKEHKYTYEFAEAGNLAQKLGVSGIPLVLVINKDGFVKHIQLGYEDNVTDTLTKKIDELISGGGK